MMCGLFALVMGRRCSSSGSIGHLVPSVVYAINFVESILVKYYIGELMGELTLRQLEYFVAVVDAGSVTAASKKVNVTQATVSMAIAQLESRLGTDLLIRQQSKGVVPTRAGRELSARARHVVAMTAEIEQVAATGTSEISGVLEIGCVSSLSPQVVPPLAAHFERHYPQVTFNYREGSAGDLQQALIDGALDMAFVFSRQTLEAVHSHDITEAILKIMLPAEHPLCSRKSIEYLKLWGPPDRAVGDHRYCLWGPAAVDLGATGRPSAHRHGFKAACSLML